MPNESFALPSLPIFGTLLLLLAGAPLLEEIVFRAGLQEHLLTRVSPPAANALTAAAFALGHGLTRSWWLAGAVLLPAIALGWLYQRERRLAPCVAAHAAMNLIWVGSSLAAGSGVAAVAAGGAS